MRIAIIGTGNVGRAIARGQKGKGHDVTLDACQPEEVSALASETGATTALPSAAAAGAEVVIRPTMPRALPVCCPPGRRAAWTRRYSGAPF